MGSVVELFIRWKCIVVGMIGAQSNLELHFKVGFFFTSATKVDKNLRGISPEFLHKHGCNVCPLNDAKGLTSPKMLPTGSSTPIILMLGDSPSDAEDKKGKLFVGKTGEILRSKIPKEWQDQLRWSTIVNCKSGDTNNVAQQCCSSRLEEDIVATKPKAIFGFGSVPLFHLTKQTGINLWRERRIPIEVGGHACWFYPMLHPYKNLLKKRRDEFVIDEELEFAFALDLRRAFAEINSLPEPVIHTIEDATSNIEIVDNVDRIAELLDIVGNDPSCGVDIETNCLRPYSTGAKILSAAFAGKENTFSFAIDHSQNTWTKLERKQIDVLIKRFLYEATCRKIVHHLPFELEWFGLKYGTGCFYSGRWDDSESQAYLLDARRGSASLNFLCIQYFGLDLKAILGLDRANLDKTPLLQVLKYNGPDARYHRLLFLEQAKRIKFEKLQEVYEHQLRRIPALVLATMHGVPVDQKVVEQLKKKYKERAAKAGEAIEQEEVVKEFGKQKGRKFNPSSPQDVNYLLKEIVGVDLQTTGKGELEHVDHPIAKMIVAWREPNKVLSTYIESIDDVSEETNLFPDKLLHPIISTTTVKSARTSSDSPNIQNFPKRDEELKEVRSQVKSPDRNMVVVSFDYAGIQARNVAMESRDKALIEAFWNDYDIHSVWREKIAKKFPKWIPKSKLQDKDAMKHYRYLAKNKFVFPTFFGAQAYNTSEGLGIPKNICEELLEEFFDQFPSIKKWHKGLDTFYREHGYVTGLSEYRCYAPIGVNQRINLPIQGDEAKIVMDAMIRLSEMEDPRYQAMLMIHDDLTFVWPKNEVEKRAEVVLNVMVNCPFKWAQVVPIEVEMSVGVDWINQKEVGKFRNDKWNGIVEIKDV